MSLTYFPSCLVKITLYMIISLTFKKKNKEMTTFSKCEGCFWYSDTLDWCNHPDKGKDCDNRISWEDHKKGIK